MKPLNHLTPLLIAVAATTPALASTGVVDRLEAMADPASDDGTTITAAEVATYVANEPGSLSGDEAILASAVAYRLRFEVPIADADYGALQAALRLRAEGLAVSLLQAPGLRFHRDHAAAPLGVSFDPGGADLTRVDLVYTWDDWVTTGAASLAEGDGRWTASLGVAPAAGRLTYAVHLFGADGRDFWLNYGDERGVHAGQSFRNYALRLEATDTPAAAPSRPALVKVVRMFTHPASPGGAAVVADELSWMVEIVTWEGGPAIQDDDVLRPAIQELETMVADGVDFQADHELFTGFLDRQRLRYAAFPGGVFERAADGQVWLRLFDGGREAEVFYSTDGWNLPHSERCSPGSDGGFRCPIGHLPEETILAYTVRVVGDDGREVFHHADRGLGVPSNFFTKVRTSSAPTTTTPAS